MYMYICKQLFLLFFAHRLGPGFLLLWVPADTNPWWLAGYQVWGEMGVRDRDRHDSDTDSLHSTSC